MENIRKIHISKYENNKLKKIKDYVIIDKEYKLFLNKRFITTFNTIENDLEYLGIGYLISEEIINSAKYINKIEIVDNFIKIKAKNSKKIFISKKEKKYINTNKIKAIISSMEKFQGNCELFHLTGAVHCSAIMLNEKLIFKTEDIGRYNTVDKAIGYCAKNKIDFTKVILLITGRINKKIMEKIVNTNIRIIASRSAPTELAIKTAIKNNVLLLGFVRNGKCNVYS